MQAARALGRRDLTHRLPPHPAELRGAAAGAGHVHLRLRRCSPRPILGFLGVGVPPYVPSWGNVIAERQERDPRGVLGEPLPGIALTVGQAQPEPPRRRPPRSPRSAPPRAVERPWPAPHRAHALSHPLLRAPSWPASRSGTSRRRSSTCHGGPGGELSARDHAGPARRRDRDLPRAGSCGASSWPIAPAAWSRTSRVCSRSGFFLLARQPMPRFKFQDLIGKTVIGFAEAPTPWQCLLTVLRRAAVDPARVRIERGRPPPTPSPPSAPARRFPRDHPARGGGAGGRGRRATWRCPWARPPVLCPSPPYMATPELLAREPELARPLRPGRLSHPALAGRQRPRRRVARRWRRSFRACRGICWSVRPDASCASTPGRAIPLLRRDGYAYLQEILLSGRFIQRPHPYEALVNTTFAREAMAAGAGAGR